MSEGCVYSGYAILISAVKQSIGFLNHGEGPHGTYIINKPRRPTNPPKQAHCSLRTRRGAAESGSKAAVGLLRWIGGSRGLLIINITSRVRGKVSISIYDILC